MAALPDWYAILQVVPGADPEVIDAAYRRLARKRHPDAAGDPAAMRELNAAYRAVGDAARRAAYDRARAAARRPAPAGAAGVATPAGATGGDAGADAGTDAGLLAALAAYPLPAFAALARTVIAREGFGAVAAEERRVGAVTARVAPRGGGPPLIVVVSRRGVPWTAGALVNVARTAGVARVVAIDAARASGPTRAVDGVTVELAGRGPLARALAVARPVAGGGAVVLRLPAVPPARAAEARRLLAGAGTPLAGGRALLAPDAAGGRAVAARWQGAGLGRPQLLHPGGLRLDQATRETLLARGVLATARARPDASGRVRCYRCGARWGEPAAARCPRCRATTWAHHRLARCWRCGGERVVAAVLGPVPGCACCGAAPGGRAGGPR